MRASLLLSMLLALAPLAAQAPPAAQDELEQIPTVPPPPAIDLIGQARAAAARGDQAEALSRYLRVLATQPDNIEALAGAGRAALAVGDIDAATGFFARAEDRAPNDGPVKAGLAAALAQSGDARAALRFFREATQLGVPEAAIAADRGLAYDLRGDPRRAQAEYQVALRAHPEDATLVRRLALSQAIGGDKAAAFATLDPQLQKSEVPAWRTRAFVKALTGDLPGAEADAATVMTTGQVAMLRPYFARLAALKPAERAAAVHLGRFPAPGGTATARAPAGPPRLAFDLAVLNGPAAPPPPPPAQPLPTPTDIVADSPALREQMRRVAAARAAPPSRAAKRLAAAAALADRREKAAADAKAREEKAAQATSKANPARHWVQVAGGANRADLPKAWAALKKKWPSQLGGRSPWTMHYRFTNRLLIGPFPSADTAQDWVSARTKEGMSTFRVSTRAGEAVEGL